MSDGGLKVEKLLAIEGFGWIVKNFKEKVKDSVYMEKLIDTIRILEENPDLMAMSLHFMAVGRKP